MSEWISVKDSLPGTAVPVLIGNPYWDYPVVAAYAGVDGVWMDTWHLRLTYTPTHWMPLPKPPEEG